MVARSWSAVEDEGSTVVPAWGEAVWIAASTREHDLRQQHRAFDREGYDGHNRHSGLTSTGRLSTRRRRRVMQQRMSEWVRERGAADRVGSTGGLTMAGSPEPVHRRAA